MNAQLPFQHYPSGPAGHGAGEGRLSPRLHRDFRPTEGGQDLAEYGLLMVLIAVVVIGAIGLIGTDLTGLWTNIQVGFAAAP